MFKVYEFRVKNVGKYNAQIFLSKRRIKKKYVYILRSMSVITRFVFVSYTRPK